LDDLVVFEEQYWKVFSDEGAKDAVFSSD